MLTTLIIVSFISWIALFFINGFTLYNFAILIPTVLFSIRKLGIHVKLGNIVTCEVLFIIFSILWRILFHKFYIGKLILTLIARIVFLCIVIYDENVYVYVQEERKKV